MAIARRVERDDSAEPGLAPAEDNSIDSDPAKDAEAYALALREIAPCGYGAVARHLGWGATRAGQAETILRLAGRIVYDRTGRGRPVKEKTRGIDEP